MKKTEIVDGFVIKYHASGKTIWSKGKTKSGLPDGYWEWYRPDKTLKRSGYFQKGKPVGEWITYDQKGNVYKITQRKQSTKIGKNEMNKTDIIKEFDRQLENLISKGYPKLAKLSEDEFRDKITPLCSKLEKLQLTDIDLEKGILPFVIVVKDSLINAEQRMALVEKNNKNGVTILRPLTTKDFNLIDDVDIPDEDIYLLVDIDRGKENVNLPPNEAMTLIKKADRSPLTIDEGIAIVTQFPEFLIKNNCFSLLASRTGKDKRVPAIWINGKKEANLGWCWDGNPHTWLGSASCKSRI